MHEVYGQPDRLHVVVLLTPEVSGHIVDSAGKMYFLETVERCRVPYLDGS